MNLITSKNNQKIKDLIKLRDDSKYSSSKSLFYVEGERIINDTPTNLIKELYILDEKKSDFKSIIEKIDDNNVYLLNLDVFDKIKDTKNSQGIVALVNYDLINDLKTFDFDKLTTCIVLDNVQDPGNLGTIIRLSEATNVSLIIISSDCCNIYNTKVIRSCMSSIFRTNIYISDNLINDINYLKSFNINIYSTILDKNSIRYNMVDYSNKCALIFGNEANGIKDDLIKISNKTLYIPMCGEIESLNVSMSATAVLYEIMRQNNFYET